MNNYIGIALCAILFLSNCKSRKTIDNNLDSYNYDYFSSKIKVNYKDENQSVSFLVNYRSKRDSICWGSISVPPGLEVARFQITHDSLQILNKLKKEYYAYDLKVIEEKSNYSLDLNVLQNILMGKLAFDNPDRQTFKKKKEDLIITQHLAEIITKNSFDKETKMLTQMEISTDTASTSITINYSNFGTDSGVQLFPEIQHFTGTLNIKGQSIHPDLYLHHTKVSFSQTPLSFPFTVSSKYDSK